MANNTLIEGLDDNQKTGLLQVIIPAADALETVSVTTSNYDAEFGRVGRRRHQRHAEVGHQRPQGQRRSSSATPRRPTPATTSRTSRRRPSSSTAASRSAGRSSEQAVLLRRLPAHARQPRLRRPRHDPDDGDAQRRLQRRRRSGIYDPLTGDVTGAGRTAFAEQPDPAGPHQPDRAAAARAAFPSRTSPARRSARTTTSRRRCARRRPTASTPRSTTRVSEKDQLSYRLSFMRPVVFDPGPLRRVRRPGQRRLRRHRHQHQLQHRRQLDARVQRHDRARRARRR